MLDTGEERRSVLVDEVEYFVAVRPCEARHVERFATHCYAIVERRGFWQATVPVPGCIHAVTQLWYRELIDLVHSACRLVSRRAPAAA